ncbi:hypothetical protein AAVH_23155 [Aphelenchoides avenae]|nr:hypothetical protein AAVH_23155 [Aphelenchus avenae]
MKSSEALLEDTDAASEFDMSETIFDVRVVSRTSEDNVPAATRRAQRARRIEKQHCVDRSANICLVVLTLGGFGLLVLIYYVFGDVIDWTRRE